MCEEMPPVKALNFLQTEVSAVVDHSDADEAEAFRSLLTYLLTPSQSAARTKEPASDEEHDDSPPRKRSRPNTPDHSHDQYGYDNDPDRHDGEGTWTDKLGDEDEDVHSYSMRGVNIFKLKEIEDPVERIAKRERRKEGEDQGKRESGSYEKLSEARFSQRNEVFEGLLEFVAQSEKQPEGSLLDVIDGDEGGL